jgi:hypothetical protein
VEEKRSARRRRTSPPERLHHASARTTTTTRPRALHGPDPPAPTHHRVTSSASEPPVSAAASPLLSLSLCCRREPQAADGPSVAGPRTPSPDRPSCHLFVQGPVAPPRTPQPPSPLHRHVVPWAWESQDPRACVRTRAASRAVPCHADAGHTSAEPRTQAPCCRPCRCTPATVLPCAVTTHRRRNIAFASRPGQCGLPSNTSWAYATHTLGHTQRTARAQSALDLAASPDP